MKELVIMKKSMMLLLFAFIMASCGESTTSVVPDSSKKPAIVKINPDSARAGDEIIITGKNFGSEQGDSGHVYFNGIKCTEFHYWSDKTISCIVPGKAADGYIYVEQDSLRSEGYPFRFLSSKGLKPVINSTIPEVVRTGDEIIISGRYFGSDRGKSGHIYFNDVECTQITFWSDTKILCIVPEKARDGYIYIEQDSLRSEGFPFKPELTPFQRLFYKKSFKITISGSVTNIPYDFNYTLEDQIFNDSIINKGGYNIVINKQNFSIVSMGIKTYSRSEASPSPCEEYQDHYNYFPTAKEIPLISSDNGRIVYEKTGYLGPYMCVGVIYREQTHKTGSWCERADYYYGDGMTGTIRVVIE